MNTLPIETLLDITEDANRLLAEEWDMHELGDVMRVPRITAGMVRAVAQALAENGICQGSSPATAVAPGVAVTAEEPAVPPLRVDGKRPALLPTRQLANAEFRAAVIADIQRIAGPERRWVRMGDFDAARDIRLPSASGVCKRLQLNWVDVMAAALPGVEQPNHRPEQIAKMQAARLAKREETPVQEGTFRSVLGAEHVVNTPYREPNGHATR